jgi:hypothetical protein
MNTNVLVAIQLLHDLTQRASIVAAVLGQAHAEGRDVSDADLKSLQDSDDAAKVALNAKIAELSPSEPPPAP